jgi:hypothetical protein
MGNVAFVAGYVLATLVPALVAGRLVLQWRRGTLSMVLALAAGLAAAWLRPGCGLAAAWLGLGLFVRVALGPGFMAPMMD